MEKIRVEFVQFIYIYTLSQLRVVYLYGYICQVKNKFFIIAQVIYSYIQNYRMSQMQIKLEKNCKKICT